MGKLADELRERSKRDDAIIVGSEIRAALCELNSEISCLTAAHKLCHKIAGCTEDNCVADGWNCPGTTALEDIQND